MSLFENLHFFGHTNISISPNQFKSFKKEEVDNKYLSIFNVLDTNKDGYIDEKELKCLYDGLNKFAKIDKEAKDISLEEMNQFIKTLKDENGKNLDIVANDLYTFINNYALKNKIPTPNYLKLLESLSGNLTPDVDISTKFTDKLYQKYERLLCDYTNEYNLVKSQTSNETIQNMQDVVNEFFEEYGHSLVSTSRENLLTDDITPSSGEKYDYVRNGHGFSHSKAEWENEKERIKQVNFANCGECQNMVLDILNDKFKGKYEYSAIDILLKNNNNTCSSGETHCAVLVKDENGEEYVIDMWLNPKDGGIFKKSEWEKLVSKIFGTNDYETETNSDFIDILTK